eukprot:CAMPEP_0172420266 /NCGR_PEP_ID=MMETSP1064-20121228/6671_1 /TAXON_ID=202472 /ORGANISM="Aulacoseira subarctica , Strain CCAP 1002/5" /LENGTH=431 /DNA_ID=CAMNT_0013160169 /DNA_START=36 /DNA_END=1331 /DNA_ORIENTATION=-
MSSKEPNKPIFRKATSTKKPVRQRSIIANEDSDSADNSHDDGESSSFPLQQNKDDPTVLEKILANKRKRELKQAFRLQEKKNAHSNNSKEAPRLATTLRKTSNSVLLNDTFSSSSSSIRKKKEDEEFDESTALGRKHKQAMEEYIQKQMQSTTNSSKEEDRKILKADEALYQELSTKIITQGEDAAGNIVSFTSTGTRVRSKQDAPSAEIKSKEGDVGSGGTMLGGTGIAEVILPIDHRIGIIRETQEAVMEKMHGPRPGGMHVGEQQQTADLTDWTSLLPMNFETGPSKRRKGAAEIGSSSTLVKSLKPKSTASRYSASSAGEGVLPSDVQAVSASYAHNFQLHSHEWISRRNEERDLEIEKQKLSQKIAEGPVGNRERVGFAVLRGKETPHVDDKAANTWRDSNPIRSNDDRVYSSFVKFQKERGGKRR